MILFLEDWKKYPTAIIDTKTTNKSFIRLASMLRSMGVKNHAFMLALINPELQEVDPFSERLTEEQKMAIGLEISINPWYFFREVARAPAQSGGAARMVEANRANISMWWCFFSHITYILIQPRQTGKSFCTDVLMVLLMNFICSDTKINLLTKDDDLRRENIRRMKSIMDELPAYLNFKTRNDASNTEEITVLAKKNYYKTHVPQSSPKNALKLGRGLTTPVLQIDEGPFQPNISIAYPAIVAAMTAAIDIAKEAGAPYGLIITTTAGKKDDKDGAFVYKKVDEAAPWSEMIFDAQNEAELIKLIKKSSRSDDTIVNGTFSHRQLGKTDEWMMEVIKRTGATGEDADRDFFNVWTSGGLRSPFSAADAKRIAASQMNPYFTEVTGDGYMVRWYIPKEERDQYMAENHCIIGADTSDAVGNDAISFVVLNIRTLEVVAAATINETNIIMFSEWFCAFLVRWKNTTAIIERRSTGSSVLDYLLITLPAFKEDPFRRLFNRIVQDAEEDRERFREVSIPLGRRDPDLLVRYKRAFGFATSGSGMAARSDLYGATLTNAVKRGADTIHDLPTVQQILALESRGGRIDHPKGEHDDMVIGWLLPHWLITQGRNLSFYGINPSDVMSNMLTYAVEIDPEEQERLDYQRTIREKLEALLEEIARERDPYVTIRLEHQLRQLDQELVMDAGESFSVEDLLKKAKERKRNSAIGRNYGNNGYQRPAMASQMSISSDRALGWRDVYR